MNDTQQTAADKIKLPAIGLLVVGILGIVSCLYDVLNVVFGFTAALLKDVDLPPQARQLIGASSSYGLIFVVINAAGSGFLIWAAAQMLKQRNHTAALVASALAIIPCWGGCCCLGLPVGIWALLVLMKPDVKSAFH